MVFITPCMGNRINSFRSCYETGVYTQEETKHENNINLYV